MKNALFLRLREYVLESVQRVLADKSVTLADMTAVVLEAPKEASHGDLATNAAMVLAKKVGMAPRALAELVQPELTKHVAIAAVEIAGPGFINLRLKPEALLAEIQVMLDAGAEYGCVDVSAGRKALVEYVSINPTGPVHVGHGRNAVFGDAIAALLEKAGFPVKREYLVNDAGNQMRVVVRSLLARYRQLFGEDAPVPADGYPGEYLIDIAQTLRDRDGDKWLHVAEDEAYATLRAFAVEQCLALIKADIETLGIQFDRYFSEFEMHQGTAMREALDFLRSKGLVYEGTLPPPKGKEVADYVPAVMTLFKATEFGLPEDQAVLNRAGQPTYFGQDIAYHWDKLKRGFDYLPVVIDVRQAGSFKPLTHAVEVMAGKPGVYVPVAYELVKVLRDGKPVQLSKRAGNIVALKDVLEEIGVDSFRFSMLTVKPTTELVFDLAKAVEKSMENPVFYVQYAHARVCAVARSATDLGIDGVDANPAALSDAARAVVRQLVLYPAIVEQAARSLEPHKLAFYASELAALIHAWYGAEKWLDSADLSATHTRLFVARAARLVLADVLGVCGVSAPESM